VKKILLLTIAFLTGAALADTPMTQPAAPAAQPPAIVAQPPAIATQATTVPDAFTPAQIDQLHQIIRDYLVNNPDILVAASKTLQTQQEQKMQTRAMSAIQNNKTALFDNPHSPTVGNKQASVILVEFYDYQCGHCKQMAPIVEKIIAVKK